MCAVLLSVRVNCSTCKCLLVFSLNTLDFVFLGKAPHLKWFDYIRVVAAAAVAVAVFVHYRYVLFFHRFIFTWTQHWFRNLNVLHFNRFSANFARYIEINTEIIIQFVYMCCGVFPRPSCNSPGRENFQCTILLLFSFRFVQFAPFDLLLRFLFTERNWQWKLD